MRFDVTMLLVITFASAAWGREYDARPAIGRVDAEPKAIGFGVVPLGSEKKATLRITNHADQDLRDFGLSLVGDSGPFIIEDEDCRTVPRKESCEATIVYRPKASGHHSAVIKTMGIITEIETRLEGEAHP